MKNSLALSILSTATVLLSLPSQPVEAFPSINQSFEQWCLQKDFLPSETKHTVEVLLKKAGTQDCQTADLKLSSFSELNLRGSQISNIAPPIQG